MFNYAIQTANAVLETTDNDVVVVQEGGILSQSWDWVCDHKEEIAYTALGVSLVGLASWGIYKWVTNKPVAHTHTFHTAIPNTTLAKINRDLANTKEVLKTSEERLEKAVTEMALKSKSQQSGVNLSDETIADISLRIQMLVNDLGRYPTEEELRNDEVILDISKKAVTSAMGIVTEANSTKK